MLLQKTDWSVNLPGNGFIYGCWYGKGHQGKLQNLLVPLKLVHPPDKLVKNNNNKNNNNNKQTETQNTFILNLLFVMVKTGAAEFYHGYKFERPPSAKFRFF